MMIECSDFFFEIMSEEIPARMQKGACVQLTELTRTFLHEAMLTYQGIEVYVTPRRLVVHVTGLSCIQKTEERIKKGPFVSAGEAAFQGFCRAQGITPECCYHEPSERGPLWYARWTPAPAFTKDLLPELCHTIVQRMTWPKRMRWGSERALWARPVRSILVWWDNEPLLWQWPEAGLTSVSYTRGHRFALSYRSTSNGRSHGHSYGHESAHESTCGSDNDAVLNVTEGWRQYRQLLEDHYVMLDAEERKEVIVTELERIAQPLGLAVNRADPGTHALLEEVAGLVEWPVGSVGHFPEGFLELPQELIVTTLRHHQRYFPLYSASGELSSSFGIILNGCCPLRDAVRQGHERVVAARLSDALFFLNKDLERPLEEYHTQLEQRLFFADLGTMAHKALRLEKLSLFIAQKLMHSEGIGIGVGIEMAELDLPLLARLARMAKADIATNLVGEFPELQGIVGAHYARVQGIPEDYACALREHYEPRGNACAHHISLFGKLIGIADRADTLVGFFCIGQAPTGSRDPMALRRAALGLIRLLLALPDECVLSLEELFAQALVYFQEQGLILLDHQQIAARMQQLLAFCYEKLENVLEDVEGISPTSVRAAEGRLQAFSSLRACATWAKALSPLHRDHPFILALSRVSAILAKENCQDESKNLDSALSALPTDEERALVEALASFRMPLTPHDVALFLSEQAPSWTLRINRFFDAVRVTEPEFKDLRLQLLSRIYAMFSSIASFHLFTL